MLVNMHEAKTQLSKLGELSLKGETIIIAKAGKPLWQLIPYVEVKKKRKPGRLAGKIEFIGDWNAADEEIADSFSQ